MIRKAVTAMLTITLLCASTGTVRASEPETRLIPVAGYFGEDTVEITPEIYVEVPTQLVFAAFEADAGVVSSPQYSIKNLSENTDVRVTLENFTQTNPAAAPLDGLLTLKLVTPDTETDLLTDIFPQDEPQAMVLTERLPKLADGFADNELAFRIGGIWDGVFDKELQPSFTMTLQFTAIP